METLDLYTVIEYYKSSFQENEKQRIRILRDILFEKRMEAVDILAVIKGLKKITRLVLN